ncbi:transmembrane channel-like protein 5 [Pungitius pungitius]|uniref:transmembrane channel-like protein 5 n=1 Tax=Pungitius pungitius TaxID=134920 RepID=UPI002E147831
MTSYGTGGLFNPAYHDSETLEIDRSKSLQANPYARVERADGLYSPGQTSADGSVGTVPLGGWHEESRRAGESFPMGVTSSHPESAAWQRDTDHNRFPPDSLYDRSPPVRLSSAMSGNLTMRWRGLTMRRMSMFPSGDPANEAFTADAIRNEMENEEQNLVKELIALSTRDQIRAIRDLPMTFEEKKHIRSQVLALKSSKRSRQFPCFADCSENVSLSFRRFGYSLSSARQTLQLWQGVMKEIGGKFGTSVVIYFVFLKWLLMFNIFSFLVNFGFITIPLLVYDASPNIPANVSFSGLEILTGAGYFHYTVMYYGGYSNETLHGLGDYNMQLAYFFTISVYMVLCGIALIFNMGSSFMKNYVLADPTSNGAWQLLCSWDFSITNERAVRQRKNNLRVQLKESLSEKAQRELLTLSEQLKHFGIYLGSWLLSTGLAVGCGASIYYLCQYEQKQATDAANWSLLQDAKTLLVPFVVSLINLVVPLFYSLFNKFEHYSSQRRQIYALVVRNVLLKMSILAVLCYYWMNVVAKRFSCWESIVGQALYRLVIVDFLFLMLGSFFGEFLSNVIGTRLLPRLGVPEFDVARNVLEIIYAQTLAWIGIYFSPLLPAIQILKFFILFYLKKVSLIQNCQPPRRSGRAAQMQTIFMALLFFPFFVGALSMVAYTAWSLSPSEQCGPFRGLNNTFSVVGVWMEDLEKIPGSQWAVWIYQNVIRSEIFYFFISLIIVVIIYIFWQVTQGRKQLIRLLKQRIVNEGKDKSFLLDKLQNLQKSQPDKSKQKNQKKHSKQRRDDHSSTGHSNSNAMVQALLARQQLEQEEKTGSAGGVPVPSDISSSSALTQAMLARQRAEDQDADTQRPFSRAFAVAAQARQRDEYFSVGFPDTPIGTSSTSSKVTRDTQAGQRAEEPPSSASSVMMQVMQARQRAEEEERPQWVPAPPQNSAPAGSSALIQAMLARQQAQNEYDDGY